MQVRRLFDRTLAEFYDQDKYTYGFVRSFKQSTSLIWRLKLPMMSILMGIKKIIVHLFKLYAETIEQLCPVIREYFCLSATLCCTFAN